ncbi:predicted protein [Botrytis cinerea T4]|uniref:Uncharacterized protein n=1 Tax=Botryotinia fuckeliana (strain T4) TaxID=999810 RepID=G2YC97_BOTF4|nr:predicted protein [Botrytis cinerea T4]
MGPQTASSAASSLLSCASSLAHAFFHLRMKVIILDKLLSLSYSPILDASSSSGQVLLISFNSLKLKLGVVMRVWGLGDEIFERHVVESMSFDEHTVSG